MICKYCGNDRTLIEAHIIPAGFFRRLRVGTESLRLISNRKGEYEKKSPIGVYDKGIVCLECEAVWSAWDEYAQRLLADKPLGSQARYHNGRLLAYLINDFDYSQLKLFFISLLWRASVSDQSFYSKIALGSFEQIAKQHISHADPGGPEDFAVVLAKFDDPLAKGMLDPHKEQFSGVTYCRFYLGGYVAYVKVDEKPAPPPLSDLSISQNKPLIILCRDFRRSKELSLIRKIASSSNPRTPS